MTQVDEHTVDQVLEVIGGSDGWRDAALAYAELTDYGEKALADLPQDQLAGVLRTLVGAIQAQVEFAEGASLAQLAAQGLPKRLLAHLDEMVALVAGTADVQAPEPAHHRESHGRAIYTYRACYLAERGPQICKFRLLGQQDGKERKLVLTIRRGRPLRGQIASVEGQEGIRILPAGRLQALITAELEKIW